MPGQGAESTTIADIAFWAISVSSVIAAVAVVQSKDLFRAALFLVVSFVGVAGMFVLLRAEFLAAVQVLIYVGAIAVLVIFAVLMTRDIEEGSPANQLRWPALVTAILFAAMAIFVAVTTSWSTLESSAASGTLTQAALAETEEAFSNTVPGIAELLVRDFVLAFEVASVLLLAAVVGALAVVRER